MKSTDIYQAKKLPTKPHYGVFSTEVVHIDTGYEESSKTDRIKYEAFDTEDDLKQWLIDNAQKPVHQRATDPQVVYVSPCKVNVTVSVDVGIAKG